MGVGGTRGKKIGSVGSLDIKNKKINLLKNVNCQNSPTTA